MHETFEEVVGRRLPALYAGARFLAGGADAAAEDLLLEALATAYSRYGTWAWDPAGLERALVDEVLDRWRMARPPAADLRNERPVGDGGARLPPVAQVERALAGLGGHSFYRAARALPARARAAIWLVTLERWSYDDTAAALGGDREQLVALLAWRDVLLEEMLKASREPRSLSGTR